MLYTGQVSTFQMLWRNHVTLVLVDERQIFVRYRALLFEKYYLIDYYMIRMK